MEQETDWAAQVKRYCTKRLAWLLFNSNVPCESARRDIPDWFAAEACVDLHSDYVAGLVLETEGWHNHDEVGLENAFGSRLRWEMLPGLVMSLSDPAFVRVNMARTYCAKRLIEIFRARLVCRTEDREAVDRRMAGQVLNEHLEFMLRVARGIWPDIDARTLSRTWDDVVYQDLCRYQLESMCSPDGDYTAVKVD